MHIITRNGREVDNVQ